jgi:HlyD family secretion protein
VVSYAADLTVANPDLQLRPGMTATADIVTSDKRNVT